MDRVKVRILFVRVRFGLVRLAYVGNRVRVRARFVKVRLGLGDVS